MSELKNTLINIAEEKRNKIIPENIKIGVQIFDVVGNYSSLDTSDATATIGDIAKGKTAYVNGEKITGILDVTNGGDIYVGYYSPIGANRKPVWVQKSKNLAVISDFSVAGGTGFRYSKSFSNLKGNTEYTLSFTKSRISGVTISNNALFGAPNIYFYNGSTLVKNIQNSFTTYIRDGESYRFSYTFTTPETLTSMTVYFDNNNGDTNTNITVSDVMLEYGTEAHEYEPYLSSVRVHLLDESGEYQYINMQYDLEELSIVPSNVEQVFLGGYNKVIVQGDENLQAQNIKSGVQIFDVVGEYTGIDTKVITDASYLFYGGRRQENIEEIIEKCCGKVTSTSGMFYSCSNLEEVDLTKLDMSESTSMSSMFSDCSKLKEINMSGCDLSKIDSLGSAFLNCSNLTTVYGFKNLGKGFTKFSQYSSNYTLNFSSCTNLTIESISDIVNNGLYNLYTTFNVAQGSYPFHGAQKIIVKTAIYDSLSEDIKNAAKAKGWAFSTS